MYVSTNIVVGHGEEPTVELNKGEPTFAAIRFGEQTVQLAGRMSLTDQAAFLREWAKRLTDMAEILDAADAPRIARELQHGRRPGDGCQLLGDYKVRHVDCTDHPAGTVTDVRTGKVVAR